MKTLDWRTKRRREGHALPAPYEEMGDRVEMSVSTAPEEERAYRRNPALYATFLGQLLAFTAIASTTAPA